MSESTYPYVNHMNILHNALERIDIPPLVTACKDRWYNQTLCQVNDSVVRLGIIQGEYHWHQHEKEDEFFLWPEDAHIAGADGFHAGVGII